MSENEIIPFEGFHSNHLGITKWGCFQCNFANIKIFIKNLSHVAKIFADATESYCFKVVITDLNKSKLLFQAL